MKLKELLKHHNIAWPSNATHVVQDKDGWIKFAENPNIKLLPNGCWDRGSCPQSKGYVVPNLPLATDWDTAIVSHPHSEGHPHAELMLQYAQDAKTHTEPWKLWELGCTVDDKEVWFDLDCNPPWDYELKFRRKLKTRIVHGVEIPNISITPEYLQSYWYPDPTTDGFCHQTRYAPMSSGDIHRAKHNLCYPHTDEGREAAILHAKAMLGDQS